MGRAPCCDKSKVKRGPWSPEEDAALKNFIQQYGTGGNWITLPTKAGLKRCGKSCRLRWLNYLRPDIKHGGFTEEEDYIICTHYTNIGSKWSLIASQLPGRTDNDVKNYWNTKLKKKFLAGKVNNSAVSSENSTQIWANCNDCDPSYATGNGAFNLSSGDSEFMLPLTEMGNYFCNYSQQDSILEQTQFRSPADVSSFSYGCSGGGLSPSSSSSLTMASEDHCGAAVWTAAGGSSAVEGDGIQNGYFGFESLNCEMFNDLGFDQEIKMASNYN